MKKILLILVAFFGMFFTFSFTVNAQDIEISSVTLIKADGATEYSNNISTNNVININSSLRYSEQYIRYKMLFQNNSNDDYRLLLPNILSSNLLITYEADSDIISGNSSKEIIVTIKYNEEYNNSVILNNGDYLSLTDSRIINFERIENGTPDNPTPDDPTPDDPTPDNPNPDDPENPEEPADETETSKKEIRIKKVIGLDNIIDTNEIIPSIEDFSSVLYTVMNPKILKIDNNMIIPLSVGETDIEFEYLDNKYILHIEIKEEDLTKLNAIKEVIKNPNTKDIILITLIILFISGFGIIAIRNKKVGKFVSVMLTIVVLLSKFIPIFVYAESEYITFTINYNVKILPQRYEFYCSGKTVYGNISDNLTLAEAFQRYSDLARFYSVQFVDVNGNKTLIPKKSISAVLVQNETKGYYIIKLQGCVAGDTIVFVYDKKKKKKLKKKIKDLTYNDLVLCWDFDNGDFTYSKPLWIKKKKQAQDYYLLEFDNGSFLKIIGGHRIYCVNKNKFVNAGISEELEIGDSVFTADGKIIKLVSQELIVKPVISCDVILDYNVNLFTGNILTTACNFPNMYDIKDMKYIVDSNNRIDVSKLNVDQKYIDGLRLNEVPKDFMNNEKETIFKINNFVAKKEEQKEKV